jgi:SAM-dependent methyltransferase
MEPALQRETEALRRSWDRHDADFLADYLVAGVEDPRINVQSILTRHFLLGLLFGERFGELRKQEFEFAAVLNWLLSLQDELTEDEGRAEILFGLEHDVENVEGVVIPHFARRLWRRLAGVQAAPPAPDYLRALLAEPAPRPLDSPVADTFMRLWAECLAPEPRPPTPLTVLELACGSANDYRALEACGLARLIAYTGLDLSTKNIANARARFPAAQFEEGNVLGIAAADGAYECVLAHDLFEHLSPAALPVAVAECCRVARRAACLGFFSVAETPDHFIRPTADYHWNTLSAECLVALFRQHGFEASVIHLGTFLKWLTGDATTHNPNAYTFVLQRGRA